MRVSIILICLFISSLGHANTFRLYDTAERFTLAISKTEVKFDSEVVNKSVELNACSLKLAQDLNAEYFSIIPKTDFPKGLSFSVDGNTMKIDPKSALAKKALSTQPRMIRFFLEVKTKCP